MQSLLAAPDAESALADVRIHILLRGGVSERSELTPPRYFVARRRSLTAFTWQCVLGAAGVAE